MNEKNATVLLGENSEEADSSVKELLLERQNVKVWECTDGIEAVRKSFEKNPDLIILDVTFPRLNGYQAARILKNDPFMNSTPIIHVGSSRSPIQQYWSRLCGGDDYLQKPVNETDLDKTLNRFLRKASSRRRMFAPVSTIPELDDESIMILATKLLEQELLRANILNEINMIDISAMSTKDLATAVMTIVDSLYDFSLGAALLLYDHGGEFFFYRNEQVKQNRLDEVKKLIFEHLQRQHKIYLDPKHIKQNISLSTGQKEVGRGTDELFIHMKESGPIRSVLAFENIGLEELKEDDQEIFSLSLELVHGVLEKKIFFHMSQELSIIDTVTEGYSMAFFIECLRREIENAIRHGHPMTLLTITLSNFEEITEGLSTDEVHGLIRIAKNLVLRVTRKSDIVARREMASFVFLFTQASLQNARLVQERIGKYIVRNFSQHLPPSSEIVLDMGICEFDQERDRTPEIFLAHAQPKGAPEKGKSEDEPS